MKIKSFIALFLLIQMACCSFAQNNAGTMNDAERIAISPYVSSDAGLPKAAERVLYNKLRTLAVKNGMGGEGQSPFLLTAAVDVLTKDITETAPPMVSMTVSINFFIVDALNRKVFSNAIVEAKGAGTNETKAYLNALKRVNIKAPELKIMVKSGKEKVLAFYNTNCDFVMKRAETLAELKMYGDAIDLLMSVPEVCKECFDNAHDKAKDVYKAYQNDLCNENMDKAKAAWAAKDNKKALGYLSEIAHDTPCRSNAEALMSEIRNFEYAKDLSQAKTAYARSDYDAVARYVARIPAGTKYAGEAQTLLDQMKKDMDDEMYAEFLQQKEKEQKSFLKQQDNMAATQQKPKAKNLSSDVEYPEIPDDPKDLSWLFEGEG